MHADYKIRVHLCLSVSHNAYEIRGLQHTGKRHHFHAGLKSVDSNNHCGNASLLQQSCDMSHGHVAYRSDRNQKGHVYLLRLEKCHPFRACLF